MGSSSADSLTASAAPAPKDLSPYYCLNAAHVSFRELRRCSPSIFAFGVLAGAKILQLKSRSVIATAPQHTRIVELADVPSEAREHLADASAALQAQGLGPRFAVVVPTIGARESVTIIHVNRERTILASAAFRRAGTVTENFVGMVSLWSDGRIIGTTNARPRLVQPPGFETVYRIGASVSELANWHREFLRKITKGKPLELDEVAQRQLQLDNHYRIFEFHRQRGVYSPLSWAEAEKLTGKRQASKLQEPARQAWR